MTAAFPTDLHNFLNNVKSYDHETNATIRLVPTEGIMSPLQKAMYASIQNERYLHAPSENAEKAIRYPDIARLQRTHDECRELAREAFNANHVLIDFLSGMHAMMLSVLAWTNTGDTVLCLSSRHGGHEATEKNIKSLGRIPKFLDFDEQTHTLKAGERNVKERVALIYFDGSNVLDWSDFQTLKATFAEAILCVDISQVMALVCGGNLENPLSLGADSIVGSTHKSFCGPQKAVAATNNEKLYMQLSSICRHLISANHMSSIAALAVCFHESRTFGAAYADSLVHSANELGTALIKQGVPVYQPQQPSNRSSLTRTQHLWVDPEKVGLKAEDAAKLLYANNIVANTLYLCRGGEQNTGAKGLRLGTTEIVRLGMGTSDVIEIAEAIAFVLKNRSISSEISSTMKRLRSGYTGPKYCYAHPSTHAL